MSKQNLSISEASGSTWAAPIVSTYEANPSLSHKLQNKNVNIHLSAWPKSSALHSGRNDCKGGDKISEIIWNSEWTKKQVD